MDPKPCQACPLFKLSLEEPKKVAMKWLPRYIRFCERMKRELECEKTKVTT